MISHIFSENFLEALSENVVIIIILLLETIIHPSTQQNQCTLCICLLLC